MQNRYYQPSNSKDAMRQIEKLFNKYCHAELTNELIQYHQNLVARLQGDIKQAAINEQVPNRLAELQSMTDVMQKWLTTRMAGKPFNGRMEHFKFVPYSAHPQFKRHVTKLSGQNNLRSTRH